MKNKSTAGILALLLGGLGVHKFYLGRGGQGVLYLIFCWTFIPAAIAFIEGIIYFTMTDAAFDAKYNKEIIMTQQSIIAAAREANRPVRGSLEAKLDEVEDLYNRGLLDDNEYKMRRAKIIKS
jgi:TM2 domain-containing membrane protein YozV